MRAVFGRLVGVLAPALALGLALGGVSGCHRAGEGEGTTPSPRVQRPLTHYTPPRATWVLALEPQVLLGEPAWQGLMDVAFPVAQREAFERLFVVRATEVREAALVRWGEHGFVALLRGDFRGRDVVRALGMRMNTVEVSGDDPARRVGFLGTTRREALELDAASFAYSGDAGPAMAHVAAADPPQSATDTERAELERLLGSAPVRYLHLVPVGPPADSPLYLVLAQQRALGASLRMTGEDLLELQVVLTGTFPATIEENARSVLGALLRSDLGRTLLGRDPAPPVVEVGEQFIRVRVPVQASTLHAGLRAVFVDGLVELFGAPSS